LKTPALALRPAQRKRIRHERLVALAFIAPHLLGMLVFLFIPIIAAFALAGTDWEPLRDANFVGLDNFRQLFADRNFGQVMINTLVYAGALIPLSIGMGLLCAVVLNRKMPGIKFLRGVLLMPMIVTATAVGLIWRWIFQSDGLANTLLATVGIQGPNWLVDRNWAMVALIIVSVWQGFGINMIIFLAGLKNIPTHLYEAAKLDGAGPIRQFRHITLPMLSPTTFLVLVLTVIGSFQAFDQVLLLTAGGPGVSTTTMVLFIYQEGFQAFRQGYAAAASLVLLALILAFTLFQMKLQRRWVHYDD